MTFPIIQTENLSKIYVSKTRKGLFKSEKREVKALDSVDLTIEDGELFGLLGPNGAGKTTLIKCLTTLLLPTSGTATVNGYNIHTDDNLVRASLGCMLMGERGLYWKLTGRENLEYFAALYHVPTPKRKLRVDYLVDLLDLGDFADRTVETLSSGQKMKFAFARSLISDAPILLLDEPTNTMDVQGARELRRIVRMLNEEEGKTIVYTTHIMSEADELCERVGIIDHGQIIALDTPKNLKASMQAESSSSVVSMEGIFLNGALDQIKELPGVINAAISKMNGDATSNLSIVCENPRAILPNVMSTVLASGSTVEFIQTKDITLEDVFLGLTGRSLSEDTAIA
ncbi:MAG: ABC transporter ATP-binding protein [Candidatus Hodarchaeota archaeon]